MNDFIVLAKYGNPYLEIAVRREDVVAVEDARETGKVVSRLWLRNGERITLRAGRSEVMGLLENEHNKVG